MLPEYLINRIMLYREPTEITKQLKIHITMYNGIRKHYDDGEEFSFVDYYFECFHGIFLFCPRCQTYILHPNGHDFDSTDRPLCKECFYDIHMNEEILERSEIYSRPERIIRLLELQSFGINVDLEDE